MLRTAVVVVVPGISYLHDAMLQQQSHTHSLRRGTALIARQLTRRITLGESLRLVAAGGLIDQKLYTYLCDLNSKML